jgi:transposase
MECMPKILYSQVIEEDPRELKELEKHHRYTHLFQRVRMLRLLKSEECRNLGEAAEALGYSWRQCQRWFASYRKGGLEELLRSRVSQRGRQELVTREAFEDLEEAMKRGEIATISEADEFLRLRHGIEYSHPDGVGQLLRRRKVKLKTGRPRHEKADPEEIVEPVGLLGAYELADRVCRVLDCPHYKHPFPGRSPDPALEAARRGIHNHTRTIT